MSLRKLWLIPLVIALIGLLASTAIHLLTWIPLRIEFPQAIFVLHILIFPLFIPLVIVQQFSPELKQIRRSGLTNPISYWKAVAPKAPSWSAILAVALGIYVFVNFFVSIALLKGGVVDELDGQRVLHSHGDIIEVLDDESYYRYKAYGVRLFSGHWLFFYTTMTLVFYSQLRQSEKATEKGDSSQIEPVGEW